MLIARERVKRTNV